MAAITASQHGQQNNSGHITCLFTAQHMAALLSSCLCLSAAGCGPGQGRESEQEPCKPCPRNFYNPGGIHGQCIRCPEGLATISEGASQCGKAIRHGMHMAFAAASLLRSSHTNWGNTCCIVLLCAGCPPGFGANPNRTAGEAPCAACQPGTYYPGGKVEPCWRCRGSAFLTSQPGSSSISQCICRPGARCCGQQLDGTDNASLAARHTMLYFGTAC
jgi:hypothetical protein